MNCPLTTEELYDGHYAHKGYGTHNVKHVDSGEIADRRHPQSPNVFDVFKIDEQYWRIEYLEVDGDNFVHNAGDPVQVAPKSKRSKIWIEV